MEMKPSLTTSTYKQLSKGNKGWKKVYITERPWKEMAMDVDSLVFFYMRKYIDIPYPTHKDERMVVAAFVDNRDRATQWIIDDMAKYVTKQLISLLKYLASIDIQIYPVCSVGYPKLKRELKVERLQTRANMVTDTLATIGKYILHFRDEVRDIVIESPRLHFHRVEEADKWCAKNYRVTISEDVDIFLFGTRRTIIVKPFIVGTTPTHFDFVDCKGYYKDKGIANHHDFVQVAFIVGTDYNRGVKGIGVKRAVEAIAKHGTVEKFVQVKFDLADDNVDAFIQRYKRFVKYLGE